LILNPPKHPNRQEEIIKTKMIKNLGAENIRIRGAIFCQERRMAL
jgi:hypothetical protein